MNRNHQQLDGIPGILTARAQWVGFTVTGGKKKPCVADEPLLPASSTNPETWRPFAIAATGFREGAFDAVAYALHGDFVGVDLDGCFNGGDLSARAAEVVKRCASYTEKSISGTGLHIVLNGELPGGRGRRFPGVEVYNQARFLICTGNRLPNAPTEIRPNPDAIDWLLEGSVTENAETAETSDDIASPPPLLSAVSVTYTLDELIRQTLPNRPGERNRMLFQFARGLRFNMELGDRPTHELKPYVRQWHAAALPAIRTKAFDESWADFLHALPRARHPIARDVLTQAWKQARTAPLPTVAAGYDSEPVRLLVGLCRALARPSPDGRFFLSSHSAAALLSVKSMTVHRWMKMLVVDGIIAVVQAGNERSATRYRWTAKGEQA